MAVSSNSYRRLIRRPSVRSDSSACARAPVRTKLQIVRDCGTYPFVPLLSLKLVHVDFQSFSPSSRYRAKGGTQMEWHTLGVPAAAEALVEGHT